MVAHLCGRLFSEGLSLQETIKRMTNPRPIYKRRPMVGGVARADNQRLSAPVRNGDMRKL